jgi:Mn2+/Fe2+ NRAMP family transporter
VLQGILLPAELVLMLLIINRKSVMGVHTNSRLANIITWATAILIGLLSLLYVVGQFIPQLLGA